MTKQNSTTRNCSVCGLQKPMMAFLVYSGSQGHTYGDICATCRGAGLTRKKAPEPDVVEKSSGSTGLQVDSEKRLQEERNKKERLKQTTELDHEQKVKKDTAQTEKGEKTEIREKAERDHRENYLGQKQQTPAKSQADKNKSAASTKEGQVKQAQGFYQNKALTTKDILTKASAEEFGKKIDNIAPDYIAKYVSSTGRSAESLFGQVLGSFMRNNIKNKSHLGQSLEKFKQQAAGAKPGLMSNTAAKQASKPEGQKPENENLATEFVKNNFSKR